jgi:sec-independent protein translocase protein TatA
MFMGGIGIWQLVIIAVIVILLFGTKKLRNIGTDLGSAVKGFKKSVTDDVAEKSPAEALSDNNNSETNADVKDKSTSKDKA